MVQRHLEVGVHGRFSPYTPPIRVLTLNLVASAQTLRNVVVSGQVKSKLCAYLRNGTWTADPV